MRPLRPAHLLALCLVACGAGQTGDTPGTTSTTTTGTPSTTTASSTDTAAVTTGGAPLCTFSAMCPADERCLQIPCALDPGPGCDEFHCAAACSSPHDGTAEYACVDDEGCCPGFVCADAACVEAPSNTTGATGGETGDTDGLTACVASSDCPADGHCLIKPCDLVDEPGCGEFHCYPECSDPLTESAFWTCADSEACCGFDCVDGQCTETIGTTGSTT